LEGGREGKVKKVKGGRLRDRGKNRPPVQLSHLFSETKGRGKIIRNMNTRSKKKALSRSKKGWGSSCPGESEKKGKGVSAFCCPDGQSG